MKLVRINGNCIEDRKKGKKERERVTERASDFDIEEEALVESADESESREEGDEWGLNEMHIPRV